MGGKFPRPDAIRLVLDATAAGGSTDDLGVAHTKVRSILAMAKELNTSDADAIAAEYAARHDADRAKLERMQLYAQSAACRWKLLLDYFNEGADFDRCGVCDNCVTPMEERLRA